MTATRYRPPVTISREDFLIEGSDADFRRSIYAMIQSVGRLLACRDAFGRELDLTPSQFAVLMGVAHCQQREGVIIKDLADHVGLAATHVTTEVGRLERAGYLIKKPSPADRRSVCAFSRHTRRTRSVGSRPSSVSSTTRCSGISIRPRSASPTASPGSSSSTPRAVADFAAATSSADATPAFSATSAAVTSRAARRSRSGGDSIGWSE